jgi:hypothetical protein
MTSRPLAMALSRRAVCPRSEPDDRIRFGSGHRSRFSAIRDLRSEPDDRIPLRASLPDDFRDKAR